jgi:hypothetical protein
MAIDWPGGTTIGWRAKSAWYGPLGALRKLALIAASCAGASAVSQYLSVKPSQPPRLSKLSPFGPASSSVSQSTS